MSPFLFLFVESCIRVHSKVSEPEIEEQIQEILKHAPNKPGGSRFKVFVTTVYVILILSYCTLEMQMLKTAGYNECAFLWCYDNIRLNISQNYRISH